MGDTVHINPQQWAAWMDKLARRFVPTLMRGVQSGALRCLPLMQKRTDEAPSASPVWGGRGAVDTGLYRNSWKAESLTYGARVYNAQPYSPMIEHGRRAAPVNREGIEKLQGWARRKLGKTEEEAKAVAFAIAKTLAKRPLLARRVMGAAHEEMIDFVMKEIDHEVQEALRV